MLKKQFLLFALLLFLFGQFGCEHSASTTAVVEKETAELSATGSHIYIDTSLSEEVLQDKILGFLLGSAIGDAMGAPTEMWTRDGIELEYGFVDSLDKVVREASPEGPWDFNLSAGGTTDDTRWKQLTFQYLIQEDAKRNNRRPPVQDARNFSRHIIDLYLKDIEALKNVDSFDPEPFEISARKMTWLQEWAMVAKPYLDNDLDGYSRAVNRFYGGDLSCAGMLYTPAIGAFYPGRPEIAYEEAYKLGIFDLGYARDLSSLTAAMASAALSSDARPEDILNVIRDVDPNDYFKSRLIGRTAYRLLRQAKSIVFDANQVTADDFPEMELRFPANYTHDSLYFARTQKAYELMDEQLQDVPFHAAEIFLVNLTALLFTEMNFQQTMEFITNFGRDNDTTGAIAGAILGAYWGAEKLPAHLMEQVLDTNGKELNIDLEKLAKDFTKTLVDRLPTQNRQATY